jgi:hypothetical protein
MPFCYRTRAQKEEEKEELAISDELTQPYADPGGGAKKRGGLSIKGWGYEVSKGGCGYVG